MISICCVGFASLDVVCGELNDCAWYLGISVCMFIVWKALLISSATVSHLVEPLCYGVV